MHTYSTFLYYNMVLLKKAIAYARKGQNVTFIKACFSKLLRNSCDMCYTDLVKKEVGV